MEGRNLVRKSIKDRCRYNEVIGWTMNDDFAGLDGKICVYAEAM